jgi:hypothetical protein
MDEEAGQCLHETELLEKEIQELNEKVCTCVVKSWIQAVLMFGTGAIQ